MGLVVLVILVLFRRVVSRAGGGRGEEYMRRIHELHIRQHTVDLSQPFSVLPELVHLQGFPGCALVCVGACVCGCMCVCVCVCGCVWVGWVKRLD